MEDRLEAARQVMRDLDMGPGWDTVVEDGMPPALATVTDGMITAIRAVSDRLGLFLQLGWPWPQST